MYAGTKVNWHELLMAESTAAANDDSLPLFLCAFSADKGSEEITDLTLKDFKNMYGSTANFFKYGQPLIQAHKILAAGGRVLGKRIVAEDATLGNLIIYAEVTPDTEDSTAIIAYKSKTVENAKSVSDVEVVANAMLSESTEGGTYPLFIICDNGRGTSVKRVRISPDYDVSKTLSYMLYKITDIEEAQTKEYARFSVYPDAINTVNGVRKSMVLTKTTMEQFNCESHTNGITAFVAKIAKITGYTVEELYNFDILFGKTVKQADIARISPIFDDCDFNAEVGLELPSGSNGSFGEYPFPGYEATDAWTNEAVKFFDGTFSPEIFDLDQHKIDFCVDANYPDKVKEAIANLAVFREDFFYFRDLGLNINSINDVQNKIKESFWVASPFIGDYLSTYEVIDDYSHKQIKVTMCYGLAPLLVNHYMNNAAAPIAGEFNNFIISDGIYETLNIIPRITPTVNQKEILDDLRVNYLNFTSDGLFSVQSTYTSQDHDGPLSYSSNVVITQMVVKAIRKYCPKIRFMLMDPGTTDFAKYKSLIEDNVITRYSQYFKSISLIYTADDDMVASKIFNASLYCYYRDFPQGEIFDVFAVEGSPETNPIE